MKLKWKKLTMLLILALTLNVTISALATELESRKLTIIQVDGTQAQIQKQNGSSLRAKKGISLSQGTQVSTGKNTYVYITADEDKTFKMDANTLIEIAKESQKSLKVLLDHGQLFFNVDKPLADDEELTFDAANTSMSIRGTSGWLKSGVNTLEFYLVEGEVIWNVNGQQIPVRAGQKVVLRRVGAGTLSPGEEESEPEYEFESIEDYTWEELPDDALVSVMEHREQIDLSAIGLDTPEAIALAEAKVEEILKNREAQKKAAASSTGKGRDRGSHSGGSLVTEVPSDPPSSEATPSEPTQPTEPTEPSEPETKPSEPETEPSEPETPSSPAAPDDPTEPESPPPADEDGTGNEGNGNSDGTEFVPSDQDGDNNTSAPPTTYQMDEPNTTSLSEIPIGTPSQY